MASPTNDFSRVISLISEMRDNWGIVGLPTTFNFSSDGKRLFFLADPNKTGASIHYVQLTDEDSLAQLEWKPLLGSNDQSSANTSEGLSKEEALRRERMRASLGLHTFSYHGPTGQILVPAHPTWFIANTDKLTDKGAPVIELKTNKGSERIDAKMSPDGAFVSFVYHNDLWIQNVATLEEVRVTDTTERFPAPGPGFKASGIAEYCMQEEFDRYTGYWWSPQVQGKEIQMLYVTIDERQVDTYNIAAPGIQGDVDKFVYPLAGRPNAKFSLSIADINTSSDKTPTITHRHLNPSLKRRFPWVEYIPRLGFSADGRSVWVQMLDRQQQYSMLISIPVSAFTATEPPSDDDLWEQTIKPDLRFRWDPTEELLRGLTLLHVESTSYWVNVTDIMHWFSDGSNRVIIASELCQSGAKDGNKMRHLQLLSPDPNVSHLYTRKPITEGEGWQIETDLLVVDEKRDLAYFMGTKDSPLECHLYVAAISTLEPAKNVARLTPSGCFHSVRLNHDLTSFVTCYSNIKEPHRVQIFNLNFKTEGKAVLFPPSASLSSTLARNIAQSKPSFDVNPPELFNFKDSNGETIYGCYYKPRHFDPSRKYPTILKVYGGPHVQYVSNDYKMTRLMLNLQLYAHLGYLVVIIDGVGSWRRGLRFEGYLRNRMGTVEVQEQVEGLTHLIKSGIVDPERIAVTGWSYGGYLSLLCLAQRPDFFKVAVSGAPVTKWEAYDTAYTERYMDTPQNNSEGYKTGSLSNYLDGIPDQPNRLLLIHGLLDENVHVCNTFELIQELIAHNKPYQLQVFPKERHGVRDPVSAKYNELSTLRFFIDHL